MEQWWNCDFQEKSNNHRGSRVPVLLRPSRISNEIFWS
jgi:hypothetical protein